MYNQCVAMVTCYALELSAGGAAFSWTLCGEGRGGEGRGKGITLM